MENTFNIDDYRDLKDLMVDKTQPLDKRLKQYIMDVKNPRMVRVGDILVQIEFTGKKSFSEALSAAFQI
ncbi:MAG: DUF6870 family protein [Monoglobaceae bacterium]